MFWMQSVYYCATGIWPLVHYSSFERVTGRKRDVWLVKTFGALLIPVGATLALAGSRARAADEARVLAIGSAVMLGTVEAVYVVRGRIRWVYLVDSAIESLFALGIVAADRVAGGSNRGAPADQSQVGRGREAPGELL